jgi:hypothetical protein
VSFFMSVPILGQFPLSKTIPAPKLKARQINAKLSLKVYRFVTMVY